MENKLAITKYSSEGVVSDAYSPLQNLIQDGEISDFSTDKLKYDLEHSITIDTSATYDGSVDLIINDGNSTPKIVNSRFAPLGGYRYKFITRNQTNATNIYDADNLDSDTNLFLTSTIWPKIKLSNVLDGGQLMGGNYTFYIKYCDEDGNETDIVSESKIISIFNGKSPLDVLGTLQDERTNKQIVLHISDLDVTYSKYNLYFIRNTSDLNGIGSYKFYKILEPYDTAKDSIVITGYEEIEQRAISELSIKYNYYNSAKTQAIVQNMLFLGNITETAAQNSDLQKLSYYIQIRPTQNINIGYVEPTYKNSMYSQDSQEYYSMDNISNYVGYWPNEYYQIGIVYLFDNGTTSNVFKLRGIKFKDLDTVNTIDCYKTISEFPELVVDEVINQQTCENTGGVFQMPDIHIFDHQNKETKPIGLQCNIPKDLALCLKQLGVVGYFFVRQNRIPIAIAQGLSIGIEQNTNIPMLKVGTSYVTESFVDRTLKLDNQDYAQHKITGLSSTPYKGLLCFDANVNPQIQSMLVNTTYQLQKEYTCSIIAEDRIHRCTNYSPSEGTKEGNLIFVRSNSPTVNLNDYSYSTRQGSAESASDIGRLTTNSPIISQKIVRGRYVSFIGTNTQLDVPSIYTIKSKQDLSDVGYIKTLIGRNDTYFAISDRYTLDELEQTVYSGDCFTNTVTVRMNYNFIDNEVPTNNIIVSNKPITVVGNEFADADWSKVNLGDFNSVPLGTWITYKCLSNYNFIRSEDKTDLDTLNKLGNYRSFYPHSGASTLSAKKAEESWIVNQGYSRTLSRKPYFALQKAPYIITNYQNRIAFSNIHATKLFTNSYRVFQGMSYQDIENSFGAIVKLIPYSQNLFCVFEHGCAIIPINEKALLSTQEGQSIHLYGAGVLPEQVTVVSADYGSMWSDSIIKTPNGYYGVDTVAKKIWVFNANGFQIISDQKLNSFLNYNINLDAKFDSVIVGITNVKTHYNNYKGDVIFTFYKDNICWTWCYNERLSLWTTRYSWTPLLSENIDNVFYSFNRNDWKTYISAYTQKHELIYTTKRTYTTGSNPFIVERNKAVEVTFNTKMADYSINLHKPENWSKLQGYVNDMEVWKNGDSNQAEIQTFFTYNEYLFDFVNLSLYKKQLYNNITYYIPVNDDGTCKDIEDILNGIAIIEDDDAADGGIGLYYQEIDQVGGSSGYLYGLGDVTELWTFKPYLYSNESHYSHQSNNKLWLQFLNYVEDILPLTFDVISNNKIILTETVDFAWNAHRPTAQLYQHTVDSLPATWYGKTEPFEFEFIVNKPLGLHKIFDNLVIISNNVEPNAIEFTIEGDAYNFNKAEIFDNSSVFTKIDLSKAVKSDSELYYNTEVIQDNITKQYKLRTSQSSLNLKTYGRRLGNIQYLEDSWRYVIQPIYYTENDKLKTTTIRDKYVKIRIKYSGGKLAIINAINTLMRLSYV